MKRRQKKPYKTIFNAMGSTRVKNATIANFATAKIPHLIVGKIVVRMTSMKDSFPVPSGASTQCGTMQAKCLKREDLYWNFVAGQDVVNIMK